MKNLVYEWINKKLSLRMDYWKTKFMNGFIKN